MVPARIELIFAVARGDVTRHGGYSIPPYNPARAAGKGFSFPSRRGPSNQEDLNGTGLPSYSLPVVTVKL